MKREPRHHALTSLGMLCTTIGSRYSLQVRDSLPVIGMLAIKQLNIDPKEYNNSDEFRRDYLVYTYLRKYEGAADDRKLEELALLSFKETEDRVATFNFLLKSGFGADFVTSNVEGVLSDAKRKIARWLGKAPGSSHSASAEFYWSCGWGKGATSSLTARVATLDNKILESRISVTPRALPYIRSYLESSPLWLSARLGYPVEARYSVLRSEFEITEDGRFSTVPKDFKSRRVIDVQPTANLFLQKGIGKMIRRRLKRCGIDLDDQSRNQILASRAHKALYATIDLAKASDSIPIELVRLLLPPDWFQILWDLRTHRISNGETSLYVHKFSAMGNGFTFELESLIFFALCEAVVRDERSDDVSEIAVYGDDIIVAQQHSSRVIQILEAVGFQVNNEKSFTEGRFFESCGKHYFDGIDVTPVYQKEVIRDLPSAIRAANRLFRWAVRSGSGIFIDSTIRSSYDYLASYALKQGRQRFYNLSELPLLQWDNVSDDGLLSADFCPFTDINGLYSQKCLHFQPYRYRGSEYALYSDALRVGDKGQESRGLVGPRDSGKFHITKRRLWRSVTRTLPWV